MSEQVTIMKRSKRYIALLCIALVGLLGLFTPGISLAQDQSVSDLMDQAVEAGMNRDDLLTLQNRARKHGIESGQIREILNLSLSLARQDLPSDFIVRKALEGFSKGVPAERIMGVLGQMKQSTVQAAGIVDAWMKQDGIGPAGGRANGKYAGPRFRDEMIRSCAKTIHVGVPGAQVGMMLSSIDAELLSKVNPSDVVAAVAIMPDLPESVQNGRAGNKMVVRMLKNGFTAEQLQQMPAAMKMAQGRSRLPASAVLEGVGRQMRGGIPAQEILHNLMNGNVGGGPPGGMPPGLENKHNHGNNGHGH